MAQFNHDVVPEKLENIFEPQYFTALIPLITSVVDKNSRLSETGALVRQDYVISRIGENDPFGAIVDFDRTLFDQSKYAVSDAVDGAEAFNAVNAPPGFVASKHAFDHEAENAPLYDRVQRQGFMNPVRSSLPPALVRLEPQRSYEYKFLCRCYTAPVTWKL